MTDRQEAHVLQPPPAAAGGTVLLGGDLSVRRMGFGTGRVAGGAPEDAVRVLRRAVELGVNFIDTAPTYGAIESLIAQALYPYPDDLVIATKGGTRHPTADRWVTDGRPEVLREHAEESLRRLKLEQIDLY